MAGSCESALPKIRILPKNGIVTEAMTVQMESTFNSMVDRYDLESAFDFIDVGANALPTASVVNTIIFKVLMQNCEERTANRAASYLQNVLKLLPSNNNFDYQTALRDGSGTFPDFWSLFRHLAMTCFSHYNVGTEDNCPELVNVLNCDILLNFFTNVLTNSLPIESFLFCEESEDRFVTFLGWINKLYKNPSHQAIVDKQFHILLDAIVNSKVMEDESIPISMLFHKNNLLTVVNDILTHCPDAFSLRDNLKKFCIFTDLPYLRAKICQAKLDELLNHQNVDRENPLTLESIVNTYIFPVSSRVEIGLSNIGANSLISCRQSPRKLRERFMKKPAKRDSELHELCRNEKCGDLLELIVQTRGLKLNQRNSHGYTPLHEACLSKSYQCARSLLYDTTDCAVKADCAATDNEGRTPLHCAAYSGAVDIANMLLKNTGQDQVMCKDHFGYMAIDYAECEEMKQLLTKHELIYLTEQFDKHPDSQSVPSFKSKEEYSMYLYSLHCLLCFYFKAFHLYKSAKKSQASHKQSTCPHFARTESSVMCSEDFNTLAALSKNIDHFLVCIKQNAQSSNCKIDTDSIPLMIFGKSLSC